MGKIKPHLWYVDNAREAAEFYVGLFPDSRIDHVTTMPAESPAGPPDSVQVVDFTLMGMKFQAIAAGPLDPFNHAVSFMVECDDQAELDRYWNAILEGGGHVEQCGWIVDRYGLCWQIVPKVLNGYMRDPDRARAKRVAEAMLKMVKLDIAALEAAARAR